MKKRVTDGKGGERGGKGKLMEYVCLCFNLVIFSYMPVPVKSPIALNEFS